MKLTFTGKAQEFPSWQQEKLDGRLKKLAKTIEQHGEREARAIVTQERHLHKVEVTLNAFDHSLIGEGSDRDLFTSVNHALDKLEKQVLKMRAKWRTTKRHKDAPHRTPEEAEATEAAVLRSSAPAKPDKKNATKSATRRIEVFRVNHHDRRKPMTLEEAILEIGDSDTYLVYRDADTERVAVLLRRKDGFFDLVES